MKPVDHVQESQPPVESVNVYGFYAVFLMVEREKRLNVNV